MTIVENGPSGQGAAHPVKAGTESPSPYPDGPCLQAIGLGPHPLSGLRVGSPWPEDEGIARAAGTPVPATLRMCAHGTSPFSRSRDSVAVRTGTDRQNAVPWVTYLVRTRPAIGSLRVPDGNGARHWPAWWAALGQRVTSRGVSAAQPHPHRTTVRRLAVHTRATGRSART